MSSIQRKTKHPTKLHVTIPVELSVAMFKVMEKRGYRHYGAYLRSVIQEDLKPKSVSLMQKELSEALSTVRHLVEELLSFFEKHAKE